MNRGVVSSRVPGLRRSTLLLASIVMLVALFGVVATAHAGTITYWDGIQPKGVVTTSMAIVANGSGAYDGYPMSAATAKLWVDGVAIPRASFTASARTASSVYFYYNPKPTLSDGLHTFKVQMSDTAGKVSSHEWTAMIAQPPNASWLEPSANWTLYNGFPRITMRLSDNTPGTMMEVTGAVRTGSASGPVVQTFGGTGVPAGDRTFSLAAELAPGTYYLTATVRDGAGAARLLQGTSARKFTLVAAPAMSLSPSNCMAAGCHVSTGHPATTTSCEGCHVVVYHEYEACGDCHDAHSGPVTVTGIFGNCESCHNVAYPSVPRHTVASVNPQHMGSCQGCHYESLLDVHGVIPTGSSYPYQCDLCHASTEPRVSAAILAGDTDCDACHVDFHPDFEAQHTAPTAACTGVGCHATPKLVDAHEAYVGAGGRYPQYENTCALCHTNEDPDRIPEGATAECATCHPDRVEFHGYNAQQHTATLGSGSVLVLEDHDSIGQASITTNCSSCHSAELGPIHANLCSTCHQTPRDSFAGWNKNCSQGGCHATYHEEASPAHEAFANDCSGCHYGGNRYYVYCDGCHPAPDGNDTTPPATTSDAKASYSGSAKIVFSARDGGKVGIISTFFKLDGGAPQRGDEVVVLTAGSHSLEFWSVDQNGNEEARQSVSFSVASDTTPPVTASDAQASYVGPVTITLTPTDASSMGVRNTYYTVNGGAAQSGRTISIPQPASGTVPYTITFWSDDYSGNTESPKSASFTVTADVTPPVTTLSNMRPYYQSAYVRIDLTSSDAGSGVKTTYYRWDGAGPFQTTSIVVNQHVTQGPHVFEYWAEDNVGNEEVHKFAYFITDWTAPGVSSNAVAEYPASGADITISAGDLPANGAGVEAISYSLNGASPTTVTGTTANVSVTTAGVHNLEYWAVDKAGNASERVRVVFTVGSVVVPTTGVIELRWNADGSVPDPSSQAWFVLTDSTGNVVAAGDSSTYVDEFGPWNGTFRITVPLSPSAYNWSYDWWDRWDGGTEYGSGVVNTPGQVFIWPN